MNSKITTILISALLLSSCWGRAAVSKEVKGDCNQSAESAVTTNTIDSTLISKVDISQFGKCGLTELAGLEPFVVMADDEPPYKPQGENVEDIGLNTIRFENWTDAQWMDNNYIRTVRLYIDAYNLGLVSNPDFDQFKYSMRGKFAILNIEPFLAGGAYITIFFVDDSSFLLSFWVYSFVEVDIYKITGYEVRYTAAAAEGLNLTREEILQKAKLDPTQKFW